MAAQLRLFPTTVASARSPIGVAFDFGSPLISPQSIREMVNSPSWKRDLAGAGIEEVSPIQSGGSLSFRASLERGRFTASLRAQNGSESLSVEQGVEVMMQAGGRLNGQGTLSVLGGKELYQGLRRQSEWSDAIFLDRVVRSFFMGRGFFHDILVQLERDEKMELLPFADPKNKKWQRALSEDRVPLVTIQDNGERRSDPTWVNGSIEWDRLTSSLALHQLRAFTEQGSTCDEPFYAPIHQRMARAALRLLGLTLPTTSQN